MEYFWGETRREKIRTPRDITGIEHDGTVGLRADVYNRFGEALWEKSSTKSEEEEEAHKNPWLDS